MRKLYKIGILTEYEDIKMDQLTARIKHIWFSVKLHHLRLVTAFGCIAFGIIIGIICSENTIEDKYDWLIGILTGLITSTAVSVFFDCVNRSLQKKKDDAVKRATILKFWNNLILQSKHLLCWEHPLYHHACDIDYMEQFVNNKIKPIKYECEKVIQFYSAVLTKSEFDTINMLLSHSALMLATTEGKLWDEMKRKKQVYTRFYNYLGHRDKALQTMSVYDYNEIKVHVEYIYSILRKYLGALEDTIYIYSAICLMTIKAIKTYTQIL